MPETLALETLAVPQLQSMLETASRGTIDEVSRQPHPPAPDA
jgi:hypothetical protein